MFDQLSAEIVPSLIKGRPNNNNNNNNNNNKAKCIPGGTLRVLAGKKRSELSRSIVVICGCRVRKQLSTAVVVTFTP
jgi:hypothetical protein